MDHGLLANCDNQRQTFTTLCPNIDFTKKKKRMTAVQLHTALLLLFTLSLAIQLSLPSTVKIYIVKSNILPFEMRLTSWVSVCVCDDCTTQYHWLLNTLELYRFKMSLTYSLMWNSFFLQLCLYFLKKKQKKLLD